MGYIQDLEKDLKDKLSDLEEERQREIIRYVKLVALDSFRNGLMMSKMAKASKEVRRETREFKRGKYGQN